jgi:hypothetical protein
MNSEISRPDWASWVPMLLTLVVLGAGAAVAFW